MPSFPLRASEVELEMMTAIQLQSLVRIELPDAFWALNKAAQMIDRLKSTYDFTDGELTSVTTAMGKIRISLATLKDGVFDMI
eukprot:4220253-Pyramimonas_sp.AAC.1